MQLVLQTPFGRAIVSRYDALERVQQVGLTARGCLLTDRF